MDESQTPFEKLSARIKNNKIVAVILFIGTLVIGVSTFTNAAKNLLDLFAVENRPAINGEWKAEVTYDWPNAVYSEKFILSGDGEVVHGVASFLGVNRGVLDGLTKGNEIVFTTSSQEGGGDSAAHQSHHYRGKFIADEIWFVMQTEGGFSEHEPIEFVARRSGNNINESAK